MIHLKKITITRSGKTLFEDFSFRLDRGDNIIVAGNNGSGKTTLLELLNGNLHPRAGKIHYDFLDEQSDWDERFRKRNELIHYVPAQVLRDVIGFHPDIYYQQRYYSTGAGDDVDVRSFLGQDHLKKLDGLNLPTTWHIPALLDLPLTTLSNGQIRKLIILRQLLRNVPRIMLFDYPFDGLDAGSRASLIELMDHLHLELGIQLIITSHGHAFPKCMNRRIVLDGFRVACDERIPERHRVPAKSYEKNVDQEKRAGQAVVEFRDVAIKYGDYVLLQGFNWTIRRGERWALTGNNGSGKTTLFSLIFADHPFAYSQPVFLFGKRRGTGESIWDIKRRISYLGPEQIHLMNESSLSMSSRDYILHRVGMSKADRLDEMMYYFDADELSGLPLRMLSSGQLQLVHLMLFFLDQKELLLLDEPFQFLDPGRKQKVSQYLLTGLDENSTLVLITHDEDDVREWTKQRLDLSGNKSGTVSAY